MAFEDLTPSQTRTILWLLDGMQSGEYKDEFYTAKGDRGGVVLHLQSVGEGSGVELEDVSESALEALAEEGYIRIGKGGRCTLKSKSYQQYKLLKDPLELFPTIEELTRNKTSSIDIFISHSSKDSDIAEALINLLRDALSIPANKIRCTSVDGYRLPAGVSTDDQLRREIYESRAFIGLITPASLQSNYVLFELGARWGARLHLVPVLAAGVEADNLRAPLTSLNSLSCDISAQVHQLVSDIASSIKASIGSPSAYQKHVDALVELSRRHEERRRTNAPASQADERAHSTPEQESDLDVYYRILADRLTHPEKYHLRALARGGQEYVGRHELRDELLRLKRFGLIEEIPGQKIGDILDGSRLNFAGFVRLTPTGEKFIQALDRIERQ